MLFRSAGNREYDFVTHQFNECTHPVNPYYIFPNQDNEDAIKEEQKSNIRILSVMCSNDSHLYHNSKRVNFELLKSIASTINSDDAFKDIISKSILTARDLRIAKEITNVNKQFWK